MIKLTPRLKMLAMEINEGETMADIGTDHGFLPIFLIQNKISPYAIMADISKGSLQKAEDNCKINLIPDKDRFDLRLGSGIQILKTGEVDAVVIAGMGGILMTEILGYDIDKSKSFKRIILQPRSQIGFLRYWLYNNGFSISKEQLVREGTNICEVLTVIPKEMAITRGMDSECVEYEFPHTLVDFKGELTLEYLSKNLKKEEFILSQMKKSKEKDYSKIRHQKYRVEYLNYLIEKIMERRKHNNEDKQIGSDPR